MTVFHLKSSHLARLFEINHFPVDSNFILFGLRGCLPVDTDNVDFASEHQVYVAEVDHIHPRCIIGQWMRDQDQIAIYAGSTSPHQHYIKPALNTNGLGANQLLTGFYADYRKGIHRPGKATAHPALVQTDARFLQRSADDLDYEKDDRIDFQNAGDNMHAAWCAGIDSTYFASAGCQVIIGYPECQARASRPAAGAWRFFWEVMSQRPEKSFGYCLLTGRAALLIASIATKIKPRLRFGSQGAIVENLQQALQSYYAGRIDGDFGPRTVRAVLAFQQAHFGTEGADGIVGPQTARALGLDWQAV